MVRSLRADCVRTAAAIGGSSGWEMPPVSWLSAAKDLVLAALWTPGYVKTSAKRCPHVCCPSTCRMNEHWEGVAAWSSQMNERISTRSEAWYSIPAGGRIPGDRAEGRDPDYRRHGQPRPCADRLRVGRAGYRFAATRGVSECVPHDRDPRRIAPRFQPCCPRWSSSIRPGLATTCTRGPGISTTPWARERGSQAPDRPVQPGHEAIVRSLTEGGHDNELVQGSRWKPDPSPVIEGR